MNQTLVRIFLDMLLLAFLVCQVAGCVGPREALESPDLFVVEQPIFTGPDTVVTGDLRRDYPFLPGEDYDASVSVGSVTAGYMVNGHHLEFPGQQYSFLPVQWGRGILFGTEELVGLLSFASGRVAVQIPGTVTWLGNICLENGGDIPYSVSHNSGRDADIAFYYVLDGAQYHPSDLLSVGEDLSAFDGARRVQFDTGRNWAMVESLISHDEIQVQFLFISSHLEETLLSYAASQDVDSATIRQAERVLSQPGGSNPHNDHLHLRLYCSENDALGGCQDSGRIHPWVSAHTTSRREAEARYSDLLHSEVASVRASSLDRLILLGEEMESSLIGPLLSDESPLVRISVASGVARVDDEEGPAWVERALEVEEDEAVFAALIRALGSMTSDEADRILTERLAQAEEASPLSNYIKGQIVNGIGSVQAVDAIPALIGLLQHSDPALRARVVWSLSRLTGEEMGVGWADPELAEISLHSNIALWRQERAEESGVFSTLNEPLPSSVEPDSREARLDELAEEILDERMYVSYLAQLQLMHLLQHEVPSLYWPRPDAYGYWTRLISQQ